MWEHSTVIYLEWTQSPLPRPHPLLLQQEHVAGMKQNTNKQLSKDQPATVWPPQRSPSDMGSLSSIPGSISLSASTTLGTCSVAGFSPLYCHPVGLWIWGPDSWYFACDLIPATSWSVYDLSSGLPQNSPTTWLFLTAELEATGESFNGLSTRISSSVLFLQHLWHFCYYN